MARSRNRISRRLRRKIRADFGDGQAAAVMTALGGLVVPLDRGQVSERILGAIVLLSNGDLARFDDAVTLAKLDWRDLLVATDLAEADWPAKLDERLRH